MTITLKSDQPIVVPDAVRRRAGLRDGDRIEFRVSGGAIHIVPKSLPVAGSWEDHVGQVLADAKDRPMSSKQIAASLKELQAYGSRKAKKAGIKEGDIVRLIHESRARRRTA